MNSYLCWGGKGLLDALLSSSCPYTAYFNKWDREFGEARRFVMIRALSGERK
jgi:hypothetical protein